MLRSRMDLPLTNSRVSVRLETLVLLSPNDVPDADKYNNVLSLVGASTSVNDIAPSAATLVSYLHPKLISRPPTSTISMMW